MPLHITFPTSTFFEWHMSQFPDARHSRFSQPQITSKGLVASRVPSPCINSCNMKLQHHNSIAGSWISCKSLLWLKNRTSQACVDLTGNEGMTWGLEVQLCFGPRLLWGLFQIGASSNVRTVEAIFCWLWGFMQCLQPFYSFCWTLRIQPPGALAPLAPLWELLQRQHGPALQWL